ncbi:XrtA/PEP-CTERM system histidine kinase PrsK [Sphingomonas sp. RS6]
MAIRRRALAPVVMAAALSLWLHSLAALLFGILSFWAFRPQLAAAPRYLLAVALALTGLSALATSGIGASEIVTLATGTLRTLAWLGFMLLLHRHAGEARWPLALGAVYGVIALVAVAALVLHVVANVQGIQPPAEPAATALLLRMLVAVAALVMVHALHTTLGPGAGGGLRWMVVALGALWFTDFATLSLRYLGTIGGTSLLAARGAMLVAIAVAMGIGLQRKGDWNLRLSRMVAYQSLSLVAIGAYFLLLAVATSILATIGGASARILQTAFVFGSTAAILTLVSNSWLRGWIKVKLAKHLFRHRYDYRAEWMRFTETLGDPGSGAAPLDERIVKALADLTDSPSGLLLLSEADGLLPGACWHWSPQMLPMAPARALAAHLAATGRIIDLDATREAGPDSIDWPALPRWMLDEEAAWVVVPLPHLGRLVGAILLARPPVARRLDWEDFDLLKLAGRQVASYLAEARAQTALAEAQRFDEFNRRFAFILHDIKNLVSQLTLTARNAERHADNPAFRADMIATLQESAGRMNALLARLSQHHRGRADAPTPVDILPVVARVAARRRGQAIVAADAVDATALADPASLEQLLAQLVQNAVDASPPGVPVTLSVHGDGAHVAIDVIDRGCGMSPAFIRTQLFKPFVSTKPGGFGVGAFEALQLAQAMGARIDVASREGEGSRFRVLLAAATAAEPATPPQSNERAA